MNTEFDNLNLLMQQTIRDSLDNNIYKNLTKNSNCSKSQIVIIRDKYKEDGTICEKCFNDNVMYYIKKRYNIQSSDINKTNNKIKDMDPNCVNLKKIKRSLLLDFKKKIKRTILLMIWKISILKKYLRNYRLFCENDFRSSEDLAECTKNLFELLEFKTITKRQYNTI